MFETIENAVEHFRSGRMLIVVDDEDRENEGDLCVAASHATPEVVTFMARRGCGLICVALEDRRADNLALIPMVPHEKNGSPHRTAFTVSVEAARGVTTGISAFDRSRTIQLLADPAAGEADFVRPGHIFPLRARPGGVLERAGHTEAGVDLARLAGVFPAAAICEVMREDGTMMRLAELREFGRAHSLPLITIADLVAHRQQRARSRPEVRRVAETILPTRLGTFRVTAYLDQAGREHVALVAGHPSGAAPVLTRLHSECLTGDVFGSSRCDCGAQVRVALRAMQHAGSGVLIYLRQEGRGIGLTAKLRAYALQDGGLDTVEANHQLGFPADARDYGVAAAMLQDLGVSKVNLLTNNPEKIQALTDAGIAVASRVAIAPDPTPENLRYLRVKRDKLGHDLVLPDL